MYRSLEILPIKPDRIESQFRQTFSAPQEEAIRDIFAILDETLSLVKDQFPLIETAAVMKRFTSGRKPFKAPIAFE